MSHLYQNSKIRSKVIPYYLVKPAIEITSTLGKLEIHTGKLHM